MTTDTLTNLLDGQPLLVERAELDRLPTLTTTQLKRRRTTIRRHRETRRHRAPCNRCCGEGGNAVWRHTGYTCFRCHGVDSMRRELIERRVWPEGTEAFAQLELVLTHLIEAREAEAQAAKDAEAEAVRLARQAERRAELEADAYAEDAERVASGECGRVPGWIGEPGQKIEGTAEVVRILSLEGDYGVQRLVVLRLPCSSELVTIGSGSSLWDLERGDTVAYRAKVKQHDTREGKPQTRITHLKTTPIGD